jgi:DNA-binding transcriptional LysR family regulator
VERYPKIELRITEGDRIADLIPEGIDCALRAGDLEDSSLIARRVAALEQVTCASPAYLAKHGVPGSLKELARHNMVRYISPTTGQVLPLKFLKAGKMRLISLDGLLAITGAEIYTAAAVAGFGFIQVPRYRIAYELGSDLLRVVLPDVAPPPMPVSVVYAQNRHLSQRIRVFVEWIRQVFGSAVHPAGNAVPAIQAHRR